MKLIIVLLLLFFVGLFPQNKKMKMEERYSFNLIVNLPDKDTAKVNSFISLADKYDMQPFVLKKQKVLKIIINVADKDIMKSTEIVNIFNDLAEKYGIELQIQKLPNKK